MDTAEITRSLEAASAPTFMRMLLEATDGETAVTTDEGVVATVAVDHFEGRRSATLEYTEHYILNRVVLEETGFRFLRFDLSDNAAQIANDLLSLEEIASPSAQDTIREFFERIY